MFGRSALQHHSLQVKVRDAIGIRKRLELPPVIIGVCGGSGSGKTTFCNILVNLLGAERVAHLKQDDYYKDLAHLTDEERGNVNFDHPDSIEFGLLTTHLEFLQNGREIVVPRYDFSTHTRTAIEQIISPKPIVLVEGVLLFSDPVTSQRLHHKIYIETSEQVRFERRMRRDMNERGRSEESIQWQFETTVRPMHELYVEPRKAMADLVVSGESPFEPIAIDICTLLMQQTSYPSK